MIQVKNFASAAEADACLESLGGYADPSGVNVLKGPATHEVAVGPVHAGVIEPGHFRFQCMGEDVYNLQIYLGYQHRGVEELIVQADGSLPRQAALAETCAGDSSIAAATAFAEIVESRDGLALTAEDVRVRTVLLELERIANHVGDLGALAGDVAFLPTASFCGRIRGEYLNMTAEICGNRFGRHAVVPGGLRVRLTPEKCGKISSWIATVKKDLDGALRLMFEAPTVCDRLEGTGVVPRDVAAGLGLVGVARRASDEGHGDVLSRALVRRTEIEEAHAKIIPLLSPDWKPVATPAKPVPLADAPFHAIVSTTAAWRGPLVHAALFERGAMRRYRIVDPSAHNWPGLAYALRGEQISNFPICNKSFNLSYCGTDR